MYSKFNAVGVISLTLYGLAAAGIALNSCPAATNVCDVLAISEIPPHLHCGTPGSIEQPSVAQPSCTTDLVTCRDSCLATKACISFAFDTAFSACTLYNKRVIKQTYDPNNGSTTSFWNHKCFTFNSHCSHKIPFCREPSLVASDNSGIWNRVDDHASGASASPKLGILTVPIPLEFVANSDCDAISQCADFAETTNSDQPLFHYSFFDVFQTAPLGSYTCIIYGGVGDVDLDTPNPLAGREYAYSLTAT